MKTRLILLFVVIILFFGCKENKFNVKVSNIKVDIEINRFDEDFFNVPLDSINQYIPQLEAKYGDFLNYYSKNIIGIGAPGDLTYPDFFRRFRTDHTVLLAKNKVKETFTDINFLKEQLTEAFRYYKYYFPDKNIPKIYTCITGFNQQIIIAQDFIAIGLENYLGEDCIYYQQLGIDNYRRIKMQKNMIAFDCFKSIALTDYAFNDSTENTLSHMIYLGRTMYFIDAIFPNAQDTLKWAYNKEQLYWINKNEKKVWDYFIENKILFSSDNMEIIKYINDAPFTTTFSNNSAPRVGIFIGRKIVGAFAKNNPGIKLNDLMNIRDYQSILRLSKYRP